MYFQLLVSNGNLTLYYFVFCEQVVAMKTDESLTLVHTVRINKQGARPVLQHVQENIWTYLFSMYSVAF